MTVKVFSLFSFPTTDLVIQLLELNDWAEKGHRPRLARA
jgi:hypothetical protein